MLMLIASMLSTSFGAPQSCVTYQDEILLLREAISELQKENEALRKALDASNNAIYNKNEAIEQYNVVIDGYKNIVELDAKRLALETQLRLDAESTIDKMDSILEKKKAKVGNIERIAWGGAILTVAAIGVYGTVKTRNTTIIYGVQ